MEYLPASIRSLALELLIPAYGVSPFENISQIKIPYDQTSHSDVYLPKFNASGAVHLIGICFIPSDTVEQLDIFNEFPENLSQVIHKRSFRKFSQITYILFLFT